MTVSPTKMIAMCAADTGVWSHAGAASQQVAHTGAGDQLRTAAREGDAAAVSLHNE